MGDEHVSKHTLFYYSFVNEKKPFFILLEQTVKNDSCYFAAKHECESISYD
jgi:hypothetical protein